MVRTGYEYVMAHRAGPLFATTAKQDGEVISISDSGMVVKYKDNTTSGIELGRKYGKAQGLTVPHSIVTNLTVGQKFKLGDILAYNDGFFKPDHLKPNQVVMKTGVYIKTALFESTKTFEDACAISNKLSGLLKTDVSHPRDIVIGFTDEIHKLVKVGSHVESDDILCIIEDRVSARTGGFTDETIDALRVLSAQTPKAKNAGIIERIEVYYNGDREDMSDSLRSIATISDKEFSSRNKSIGKSNITGKVDNSFRIEGDPLPMEAACIRVYITHKESCKSGDKIVFSNQLKSVVSDTFGDDDYVSETGVVVDAVFGCKSIYNRVVYSPFLIGTTATLLKVLAKKAVMAYNGSK